MRRGCSSSTAGSATETQTRTATPSPTPTATPSASFTVTSSFTASPTITETPVPVPFRITARVYNSAGELVKQLYDGRTNVLPQGLNPDKGAFVGGWDQVRLPLPGVLAGGATALLWDGSNDAGQWVGAGTYYVKLEAADSFGAVTSLNAPVTVLPAPSEAWLRLSNDAGELIWQSRVPGGARGFSLSDATVALAGEGQGASGPALRIQVGLGNGGALSVDWDGRNSGGRLVSAGVYNLSLSSAQPGASTVVQSAKVSVLRGSDADLLGAAILGPNPALRVDEAQLRYAPRPGLPARVELYNLAGERVEQAEDPAQSGTLRLKLGRLASGTYVCVLRQGPQRRVMKLAVVR